MGLREDALAAAEAARDARVASARAVLAARLDTASVEALTVADVTPQVVVFGDGEGLFLAVRDGAQPQRVTRVVGEPSVWTDRGEVDSLSTLGRILAAETEAGDGDVA